MKREVALLLVLMAAPAGAQTMLTLHENAAGSICYRVERNAVFLVSLPAVAGSGFSWSKRDGDAFDTVGEAVKGTPAGGRMVAGGPEIQTLRFKANRPGVNNLTLVLALPGQEGAAPIRTLRFCLTTPAP